MELSNCDLGPGDDENANSQTVKDVQEGTAVTELPSTSAEKNSSLDPPKQVVKLDPPKQVVVEKPARDLSIHPKAYNAPRENMAAQMSLEDILINQNASLHQISAELQEKRRATKNQSMKNRDNRNVHEVAERSGDDDQWVIHNIKTEDGMEHDEGQKRGNENVGATTSEPRMKRQKTGRLDTSKQKKSRGTNGPPRASGEGSTGDPGTSASFPESTISHSGYNEEVREGATSNAAKGGGEVLHIDLSIVKNEPSSPTTITTTSDPEPNPNNNNGSKNDPTSHTLSRVSMEKVYFIVPYDEALFRMVAEVVTIPPEDLFQRSGILQFQFTNYSTMQIAGAVCAAIFTTNATDVRSEMVTEENQITGYFLAPQFTSLLIFTRYVVTAFPFPHANLPVELCGLFAVEIAAESGVELLENEEVNEHVGRFFGALAKTFEEVEIGPVVVTVGGVKGPLMYSFLYGISCSDSTWMLPHAGQGEVRWRNLDVWVRSVLLTAFGAQSFPDSKWRNRLIELIHGLDVGRLIPVHLAFDVSVRKMLKEVITAHNDSRVEQDGMTIAMMIVHRGWSWLNNIAHELVGEFEELWRMSAVSDRAFGEVVLLCIGIAVSWMKKENTPRDLNNLKKLMAKYASEAYPQIIQLSAESVLKLLETIVTQSAGSTVQATWTYEKTVGRVSQDNPNAVFMQQLDDLFFRPEHLTPPVSSETTAGTEMTVQKRNDRQRAVQRPTRSPHSEVKDTELSGSYFSCNCKKSYKTRDKLQRHIKRKNNEIFICEVCVNTFKSHFLLDEHVKDKHPDHEYVHKYFCSKCGEQFAQSSKLVDHINSHYSK